MTRVELSIPNETPSEPLCVHCGRDSDHHTALGQCYVSVRKGILVPSSDLTFAPNMEALCSALTTAQQETELIREKEEREYQAHGETLSKLLATTDQAERMRHVGAQLANMAFNLSQQAGSSLSQRNCELFYQLSREWDAIVSPPPATGDTP